MSPQQKAQIAARLAKVQTDQKQDDVAQRSERSAHQCSPDVGSNPAVVTNNPKYSVGPLYTMSLTPEGQEPVEPVVVKVRAAKSGALVMESPKKDPYKLGQAEYRRQWRAKRKKQK